MPSRTGRLLVRFLTWMGPLYIKLGQIWANSGYKLSDEAVTELRQLQNKVPFGKWEVRATIKEMEKKGIRIGTVIASGSIAVVFNCTLPDGTSAVAKIRRADIVRRMHSNVVSFARFLRLTSCVTNYVWGNTFMQNIQTIFQRNQKQMIDQTNFQVEIQNMILFKEKIDIANVKIPKVHESFCNQNCIIMEKCPGRSPLVGANPSSSTTHSKTLIEFLLECPMHGVCHGDLHLGNLLVDDKTLSILDYGLVFHLKDSEIRDFHKFVYSMSTKNTDMAFRLCTESLIANPSQLDARENEFKRDLNNIIDNVQQQRQELASLFEMTTALFKQYDIQMRSVMLNLQLAYVACESSVYELDPECDVWKTCKNIVIRQEMQRLIAKAST